MKRSRDSFVASGHEPDDAADPSPIHGAILQAETVKARAGTARSM